MLAWIRVHPACMAEVKRIEKAAEHSAQNMEGRFVDARQCLAACATSNIRCPLQKRCFLTRVGLHRLHQDLMLCHVRLWRFRQVDGA